MELKDRFWSKVDIKGEDDCWNWKAGIRGITGYGCFKYNKKVVDSHRMVWFLIYGEFPKLWVLHKCDNRLCCNPDHLFLGTYMDNIQDRNNKGRTARGDNSSMRRHPEKISYGEKVGTSKLSNKDAIKNQKIIIAKKNVTM